MSHGKWRNVVSKKTSITKHYCLEINPLRSKKKKGSVYTKTFPVEQDLRYINSNHEPDSWARFPSCTQIWKCSNNLIREPGTNNMSPGQTSNSLGQKVVGRHIAWPPCPWIQFENEVPWGAKEPPDIKLYHNRSTGRSDKPLIRQR